MSKHGSTLEVSAINQTRPSCFGRTGPNVRFRGVFPEMPRYNRPFQPSLHLRSHEWIRMEDSWKPISMFVEHRLTTSVELKWIKKAICSNHIILKNINKNDLLYIHYSYTMYDHVRVITIINQSTPQCMLTHSQRRNVVSSHRQRTGPCNFSANSSQVGAKTF